MSLEALNSRQPGIVCLPNPEDYTLLSFIGEKIILTIFEVCILPLSCLIYVFESKHVY